MSSEINIAHIQQLLYFRLMDTNVKQWPIYLQSHTTRFYNIFIIIRSQRTKSHNSISQVPLLFHFPIISIIIPCTKSHYRVYPLLPLKTQISIHLFQPNETSLNIHVNSNINTDILWRHIHSDVLL